MYNRGKFSFDVSLDIWKQPKLEINGSSYTSEDYGFGHALSIRGYYEITNFKLPLSVISEIGYKTSGFLQGYVLDAAPIFLFGLGIRN